MDRNTIKRFILTTRETLISLIENKSNTQTLKINYEDLSYKYFIRICALLYMEINNFIPTDNISHYFPDKILSSVLPGCFSHLDSYENEFLSSIVSENNDFIFALKEFMAKCVKTNGLKTIGKFFQCYNSERKDRIFSELKNNKKIQKEDIPAATELFTPEWIVKYMSENSLGRLWYEANGNNEILSKWKYFINTPDQDAETKKVLLSEKNKYNNLKPEEIKIIDPCCGCGNILIYIFDVLMDIYISTGHSIKYSVKSIIKNNIYGLDIDNNASELARFSIIMKAAEYDKDFLCSPVLPNIYTLKSSKSITEHEINYLTGENTKNKDLLIRTLDAMENANEYGSLIRIKDNEISKIEEILQNANNISTDLNSILKSAILLSKSYDIVITNPPYMGRKSLNNEMNQYLSKNYPDGKSELYSAFILRCTKLTKDSGFTSMITIHSWMFISSFKKLREYILDNFTIDSLLHTGAATFEELNAFNALSVAFVLRKFSIKNFMGTYINLTEFYEKAEKIKNFSEPAHRYILCQNKFRKIPGCPLTYGISDAAAENFTKAAPIKYYSAPKQGLATADNNRFVRFWFEVNFNDISFNSKSSENSYKYKWFPYNKGGNFRKWYGMNEYIVNWASDGKEIRNFKDDKGKLRSRPQNTNYYFKSGITWSLFGFENFSVRYKKNGFIFDVSGSSMFPPEELQKYILAFLCSKIAFMYLSILAPTVNFQVGDIGNLPLIIDTDKKKNIEILADQCISISEEDWNDSEVSWDFSTHPFIKYGGDDLPAAFNKWKIYSQNRYDRLKMNEEQINRYFINIYNLKNDLTPEVKDRDIALRTASLHDDVVSFLSYAVGCIFGRYSIDNEGIIFAGGEWNEKRYKRFIPVKDNIIPLNGKKVFNGRTMTNLFIQFLKILFGEKNFNKNIKFIADALGGKGTPEEIIENFFINNFYKEHCKTYKGLPIYWLFDSGKEKGFRALIYIHRYDSSTISNLLNSYVKEIYNDYKSSLKTTKDKNVIRNLNKKITELDLYIKKLQNINNKNINIDPDKGIKYNYSLLKDLLSKI